MPFQIEEHVLPVQDGVLDELAESGACQRLVQPLFTFVGGPLDGWVMSMPVDRVSEGLSLCPDRQTWRSVNTVERSGTFERVDHGWVDLDPGDKLGEPWTVYTYLDDAEQRRVPADPTPHARLAARALLEIWNEHQHAADLYPTVTTVQGPDGPFEVHGDPDASPDVPQWSRINLGPNAPAPSPDSFASEFMRVARSEIEPLIEQDDVYADFKVERLRALWNAAVLSRHGPDGWVGRAEDVVGPVEPGEQAFFERVQAYPGEPRLIRFVHIHRPDPPFLRMMHAPVEHQPTLDEQAPIGVRWHEDYLRHNDDGSLKIGFVWSWAEWLVRQVALQPQIAAFAPIAPPALEELKGLVVHVAETWDRRLPDLSNSELEELLLEVYPRQMTLQASPRATCITLALAFQAADQTPGMEDPRTALIGSMTEEFVQRMEDPARWGPAKRVLAEAGGPRFSEPMSRDELEALMREAYGPPLDEFQHDNKVAAKEKAVKKRRKKRKAAKKAKKKQRKKGRKR